MKVKCPRCGKPAEFVATNTFRPFCSERCATLDLGAWADERYRVPVSVQERESVNEKSEDGSLNERDLPPLDHRN